MRIKLPPLDVKYVEINKSVVTQRAFASYEVDAVPNPYNSGGFKGFTIPTEDENSPILVIGSTRRAWPSFEKIIDAIKNIIPKVKSVNSSAMEVDKEKENILNKVAE